MNQDVNHGTIYGLVDPRDNKVFYIGSTLYILNRARWHCKYDNPSKLAKSYRTRKDHLRVLGLEPRILILEDDLSPLELSSKENTWIRRGFDAGWPLSNQIRGTYR